MEDIDGGYRLPIKTERERIRDLQRRAAGTGKDAEEANERLEAIAEEKAEARMNDDTPFLIGD